MRLEPYQLEPWVRKAQRGIECEDAQGGGRVGSVPTLWGRRKLAELWPCGFGSEFPHSVQYWKGAGQSWDEARGFRGGGRLGVKTTDSSRDALRGGGIPEE